MTTRGHYIKFLRVGGSTYLHIVAYKAVERIYALCGETYEKRRCKTIMDSTGFAVCATCRKCLT